MKRILVIEDNESYRKMLKIYLEKEGYEIIEAATGQKGYQAFLQNKDNYNLIIMDLFLPELDGVQAIHKIKEEYPETKIIAMTGASSEGRTEYVLEQAKTSGADVVYKKTSDINELLSQIKLLLK